MPTIPDMSTAALERHVAALEQRLRKLEHDWMLDLNPADPHGDEQLRVSGDFCDARDELRRRLGLCWACAAPLSDETAGLCPGCERDIFGADAAPRAEPVRSGIVTRGRTAIPVQASHRA